MALTKVKGNIIEDGAVTSGTLAATAVTSATIQDNTIANVKMAVDPSNASNLSSGDVPAAQLDNVDLAGLEDDIALLGFKAAANGSLAKYDLVDQTVDAFEDASGVDAGTSTNEYRDASGKYYSGTVPEVPATIETFNANGTYTSSATTTSVDWLVVAGGGGGGHNIGSGGGAGGYRTGASFPVTASTAYPITVGAGGAGSGGSSPGTSGGASTFSTITSAGGGGGGSRPDPTQAAGSGGSGGGGSSDGDVGNGGAGNTPAITPVSGETTTVQGYPGVGNATGSGAGGGGASAASVLTEGGADGVSNSISGSAVYYAGGGGAGGSSGNPPDANQVAGLGGGGAGQANAAGGVGTANTGGGGGGGNNSPGNGYAGGSGVVIISWGYVAPSYTNMTLVSNATTAQAVPTKGDMVMTYTNGAGTAVINTNIKGYVSRDGGTTYTQGTLASQGTTGGHTILSFHDLDISGQPSGSSMRYKIETLVQSASLYTNIQAVSLGWS